MEVWKDTGDAKNVSSITNSTAGGSFPTMTIAACPKDQVMKGIFVGNRSVNCRSLPAGSHGSFTFACPANETLQEVKSDGSVKCVKTCPKYCSSAALSTTTGDTNVQACSSPGSFVSGIYFNNHTVQCGQVSASQVSPSEKFPNMTVAKCPPDQFMRGIFVNNNSIDCAELPKNRSLQTTSTSYSSSQESLTTQENLLLTTISNSAQTGGYISMLSGLGTASSSGNIMIRTSNSGADGVSGDLAFLSGTSSGGSSGSIRIGTGTASGGDAGDISIVVGDGNVLDGGHIYMYAGKSNGASDTGATGGSISMISGFGTESSSGSVIIRTLNAGVQGVSGELMLQTGNAPAGKSPGSITLKTGTSGSNVRGNILFDTGTDAPKGVIIANGDMTVEGNLLVTGTYPGSGRRRLLRNVVKVANIKTKKRLSVIEGEELPKLRLEFKRLESEIVYLNKQFERMTRQTHYWMFFSSFILSALGISISFLLLERNKRIKLPVQFEEFEKTSSV